LIRDKVARYQTNFLASLNAEAFTIKDFSLIAKELTQYRFEKKDVSSECIPTPEKKKQKKLSKFSHMVRK